MSEDSTNTIYQTYKERRKDKADAPNLAEALPYLVAAEYLAERIEAAIDRAAERIATTISINSDW